MALFLTIRFLRQLPGTYKESDRDLVPSCAMLRASVLFGRHLAFWSSLSARHCVLIGVMRREHGNFLQMARRLKSARTKPTSGA